MDKLKKFFSIILISTLCLGLFGCGFFGIGDNDEDEDEEEWEDERDSSDDDYNPEEDDDYASDMEKFLEEDTARLKDILLKEADASEEDIQFWDMEDFDSDGEYEAFALIGDEPDYDFYEGGMTDGDIWFVNHYGATRFTNHIGMGLALEDNILDFGTKKYIAFYDIYATGSLCYVYEVNGKEVSEASFSGYGTVKYQDNAYEFRIVDSNYDMFYDPSIDATMGHTWKSYYFYYDDEADEVKEYGGIEISKEQATDLVGRDLVAECLTDADTLDSIIYRGNGIVHVNYSSLDDYGCTYHYHVNWDMENEVFLDDYLEESDEPQYGTYWTEMCPEIAEYPTL